MAIDDIVAKEQGNSEPALLDGDRLKRPHGCGCVGIEDPTHQPLPHLFHHCGTALGPGDIESRHQQIQLANFLFKGHSTHQMVDKGVHLSVSN